MPQPRGKQFYDELGNTLQQHLMNLFSDARVWKVGSRDKGDFKRTSDLDYHFCLSGSNRPKNEVYRILINYFKNNISQFRGEQINTRLGTNGNVVNVLPTSGKISFALKVCP